MKFRFKMTLCMLGLLSILFGVGGSLLISASFHTAMSREKEAAYHAYQMVMGTLQIVNHVNGQSDYEDIAYTLQQLSDQNADPWVALRLGSGEKEIYSFAARALRFPEGAGEAEPGVCAIRYFGDGRGGHFLSLSGALAAGGETMRLDMARDISDVFETRQTQQQIYLRVFLLMAALCALLAYTMSRLLTGPLESLSRATRALASGQLSSRARIRGGDEVGELARDFNAMAGKLEVSFDQLQDTVNRQERFMGSFAHELKTPMTSIIGYADLIRGRTLTPEEQAEAADYILSEGKRLENLSRKLLDILVLKRGEPELAPERPAALIGALAERMEPVYRAQGVSVTWACREGSCLLEADLVRSLLMNLLDNARKALEGRGGAIHIQSDMLADGCVIRVLDNGPGIPPQALAHLTEAFYRVDKSRSREQGGVGLGLALCQEIAQLHGGSIRFESQMGLGSTVIVELRGGAA